MQNKSFEEAIYYFKSRKFVIAEKKVVKLIEKFPNNYTLYNLLGSIFAGQKNFGKAVINFKKSIQINPNYVVGYNNLAVTLAGLKKFDESINNYQQAIQIRPDYAAVHKNLGKLLRKIGRVREARKCFDKVINLEPDDIEYKINRELLIAPIVQSTKEINFYRSQYAKGLQSLAQYKYVTQNPGSTIKINSFYLSYHNKDNLELMKKTSEIKNEKET